MFISRNLLKRHFHLLYSHVPNIFFKFFLASTSARSFSIVVIFTFCMPSVTPYHTTHIMTSSNGNIFLVTGHLCGNSPVPGEFPTQRPVTPRSFGVFFDLRLNKQLSKQPWGWWFETPSWSLRRQCNAHEDFITWRGFPRYWLFMGDLDVFFDISLNKLLSTQPIYQWFEMPLRSCDVTVMWFHTKLWVFPLTRAVIVTHVHVSAASITL